MKPYSSNIVLFFGVVLAALPSMANAEMSFEEAMNAGKDSGHASNSSVDATNVDPNTAVPGYSPDTPPDAQYYDHPEQISGAAATTANQHEASQFVRDGYANRPSIVIDAENDPMIKSSRSFVDQADSIVGVGGDLSDCTLKTIDYVGDNTQEVCTVYGDKTPRSCEPTLDVTCHRVTYTETKTHIGWYTLATYNNDGKEQWCDIDFWEPNGGQIYVHAYFNRRCIDCYPETNPLVFTRFGDESCTKTWEALAKRQLAQTYAAVGEIQSITFSDGALGNQSELVITTTNIVDYCNWTERWDDSQCAVLEGSHCIVQNTQCIEGPETRVIEDPHSIAKDCWKRKKDYLCLSGAAIPETYCQELTARGCTQSDSECVSVNNGYCAEYKNTFDCPSQKVVHSEQVMDCSTQTYCMDGNCFDSSYPPNEDLALAATHLAFLDALADEFDPTNLAIFGGDALRCSKAVLGFSNCCKDSGWGIDLSLDSCSSDEKRLGERRENQACHFIGDYCSNEDPFGTCTSRRYVYCCYGSELSRLIQEGAHEQLGLPWGDVNGPQCQGVKPEQLQQIDFSQIDFSPVYPEVMGQVQQIDQGTLQTDLQQRMQQKFQQ